MEPSRVGASWRRPSSARVDAFFPACPALGAVPLPGGELGTEAGACWEAPASAFGAKGGGMWNGLLATKARSFGAAFGSFLRP